METFVASPTVFEKLLNQCGAGMDRYIYRQSGVGLGNFLAKLFRHAKPLLGTAINTIKPELQSAGSKLIDVGSKAAISQIEKLRDRGKQKLKRRRDNLDNE